jgi:hypothetical protein
VLTKTSIKKYINKKKINIINQEISKNPDKKIINPFGKKNKKKKIKHRNY